MQFGERLTDLDKLLLRCRDPQSKVFLAEAIACYRAGAYRAAIISTWIALVFDLISKFKELALTGDVEAQNTVVEIERMYPLQRHYVLNVKSLRRQEKHFNYFLSLKKRT